MLQFPSQFANHLSACTPAETSLHFLRMKVANGHDSSRDEFRENIGFRTHILKVCSPLCPRTMSPLNESGRFVLRRRLPVPTGATPWLSCGVFQAHNRAHESLC